MINVKLLFFALSRLKPTWIYTQNVGPDSSAVNPLKHGGNLIHWQTTKVWSALNSSLTGCYRVINMTTYSFIRKLGNNLSPSTVTVCQFK